MSKLRRIQTFIPKYSEEFDFITKSTKGSLFALCTVCNSDITISHGGRSDILQHATTSKHASAFNKARSSAKISSFMASESDNQTIKAELLFTGFILEHNIPLAAADHVSKLLMAMFPNSPEVKKYACGRTKSGYLVKEIASKSTKQICDSLKKNPFSISTDGSNDADTQMYPLVVTYFDEEAQQGSVFATFETKEDAEKFLELKGIKYGNTDLLREWKIDYMKRKDEYFNNLRTEKEKKMLKKQQEISKEEEEQIKNAEKNMILGCLLKIDNLKEDTMREQIQEIFEPLGTLLYIDYSKGKPFAVLRFDEGQAKSVLEKISKEGEVVKIGSSEATVTLIEGDEEKEYWKTIAVWRANRRKFNKSTKNYKGYNKSNKNFQSKKRKWSNHQKEKNEEENGKHDESSEPLEKQRKVETCKESDEKDSAAMEVNSNAAPEQKKAEVESHSES